MNYSPYQTILLALASGGYLNHLRANLGYKNPVHVQKPDLRSGKYRKHNKRFAHVRAARNRNNYRYPTMNAGAFKRRQR
ncbi:MAG: hypothetical protein P1V18_01300 [Candidatus Gracilibacteria bacterium]|nr:hypothetical protein [Candidatus Gracilibacteria bacterium]